MVGVGEGSPVAVALRHTRKGRLSYDRSWDRDRSVERVLREVTGGLGSLGLYREEGEGGELEEQEESNLSAVEEVLRSAEKAAPPSPSTPSLPPLTTLPLLRTSERKVGVRKGEEEVVRGSEEVRGAGEETRGSEGDTSPSMLSPSTPSPLDSSIFSYSTPDLLRSVARKGPRVDLAKIRLPDHLLVGRRQEVEVKEEVVKVEEVQSAVEEELLVYEEKRREDAVKRQQERRRRWDKEAEKRAEEAREQMEEERRGREEGREEEEEGLEEGEIERRVEERLVEVQHEREERQRELILLARREEEEAREEGERRRRCKEQTSRLAPLHTRIKGRVQALLTFWTHQQDKTVFSEEVTTGVPAVLSQCNVLLKEAREEVGEGRAEEGLWGRLASLEQSLGGILAKVELDMAAKLAREKEKVEEEQRRMEEEEKRRREVEEEARRAAAAPPAAAPPPAAPLVAPVAPVAPVATTSAPLPASSADNEGWYASVKKFKEDYVKDVKFEDKDKPYKFNLQKAVNTPLNSLSGVSPTHLQDKVDKLVSLLSGETVTVVDRQLSVASHPHARSSLILPSLLLASSDSSPTSSPPPTPLLPPLLLLSSSPPYSSTRPSANLPT